jgi:hypothetical protein
MKKILIKKKKKKKKKNLKKEKKELFDIIQKDFHLKEIHIIISKESVNYQNRILEEKRREYLK